MTRFAYKATPLSGAGGAVVGRLEATDEEALRQRLREQGLLAIDVRPVNPLDALRAAAAGPSLRRRDMVWFFRSLRRLLEGEAPIEQAISAMEELAPRPTIRRACLEIRDSLRRGESLAAAVEDVPGLADRQHVALLRIGHESGRLRHAVELIERSIGERERIRRSVASRLIYPAILLLASVGAVWFLAGFVIPRFAETLESVGADLPLTTTITLEASRWLVWIVPPLLLLGVILLASRSLPLPAESRARLSRLALRIPIVRDLVWHSQAAIITDTIATMLDGGGDLLSGVEQAEQALTSEPIRERLARARQAIREGTDPAEALHEHAVLPPETSAIARIGGRSGDLVSALRQAGRLSMEKQEEITQRLLTLMEPAVILFLAGVVGWIVYSLIIGMLTINETGAV